MPTPSEAMQHSSPVARVDRDWTALTGDSAGGNLASLLWNAARTSGDHPAIVERGRSWTYAELQRRASAIANALLGQGVAAGDRVAILLERGAEAAASIFAVHAIGAIAIVINERFRPRQIEYVLTHAGADVLLTAAELLSHQPRQLETGADIIDVPSLGADGSASPVPRLESDFAQILYTSGSTGLPKGVTFTHGGLHAGVATVAGYLGLTNTDRIASLLPFSSVYGLNQLLCAVRTHGTLVIESSPIPTHIAERLRAEQVTVVAGVPPLWLQLLGTPAFASQPIASLRIIQNAGGHCPREAVRKLRVAQPQAAIFLQYGMTETFRSTYLPPDEVDRRPDSMGLPMPGVEILVVDEHGRSCAPGEIGELVHHGPTIAAGYWGDPDATARVFRAHPFKQEGAMGARVVYSGDMVRRDADGFLYYVSRRDRLIKTLGFRVGPDEIVDVLFASGQIDEAVVTTEPDPQRGERIVAYVVLGAEGSLEVLERYSRTELPRHMQPARIELRDVLARLSSAKYDLDAIRAAAAAR